MHLEGFIDNLRNLFYLIYWKIFINFIFLLSFIFLGLIYDRFDRYGCVCLIELSGVSFVTIFSDILNWIFYDNWLFRWNYFRISAVRTSFDQRWWALSDTNSIVDKTILILTLGACFIAGAKCTTLLTEIASVTNTKRIAGTIFNAGTIVQK